MNVVLISAYSLVIKNINPTKGDPMQKKYMYGDEQFPILYENDEIRIFKNPSNEIFVESVKACAESRIRINISGGNLLFTTNQDVRPIPHNNMVAWLIE